LAIIQKKSTLRYAEWRGPIFVVEYLHEYKSIFETALAHESVDPVVLFDEKKPEVENLFAGCICAKLST
jgi:hypothetical protein